jgi:hypothetical protein
MCSPSLLFPVPYGLAGHYARIDAPFHTDPVISRHFWGLESHWDRLLCTRLGIFTHHPQHSRQQLSSKCLDIIVSKLSYHFCYIFGDCEAAKDA